MKKRVKVFIFILILVVFQFFPIVLFAQKGYVTSKEAFKYVGEVKTVCGFVASTFYAVHSRGQPTFLNFDRPYPNQSFTAVIWGEDRYKFQTPPEVAYKKQKNMCYRGNYCV